MQKYIVGLLGIAAVALVARGVWPRGAPRADLGMDAVMREPAAEITYVCRETGELIRGPREETPALNPKTGRRTLVQALYCNRCRQWYKGPPRDRVDRQPLGPCCPHDGTPLAETE